MIYHFLKIVLKVALSVFFRKMVVTGQDKIPTDGPLMVAGNHPNTLMDPLIVAVLTKQKVGFIGNASIFVNSLVNRIFHHFRVIPIYRKKDLKPGETTDNREAFKASHAFFDRGGTLLVFPEGSSYYELKLREVKTGSARIALSYEQLKDYEGNLRITPVSLDYSDSLQFRSMLSVHVHDTIQVSDFKETYEKDNEAGIAALTEEIRKALASRIPHTTGKDQESFLIHAHRFYTTYIDPSSSLYTNPKASLSLRSIFSQALQKLEEVNSSLYHHLKDNLEQYYSLLEKHRITSGFFTEKFQRSRTFWAYLGYLILFLGLLPFYLFGLVSNYLPFALPGKIFRAMKIDIEYKTSVALVGGIVFFPLFYGIELFLFRSLVSTEWGWSLAFLALLPLSGFLTMYYWTNMNRFFRLIRYTFSISKKQKSQFLQLRDEILVQILEAQKVSL